MATPKRSYTLPSYLKWGIQVLEKIHPYFATKLALRLFFTPLKFPVPAREIAVREKARKEALMANGKPFTSFEWTGSGPKILLCHGWSGRGSQFFELIERLLEKEYHVVTFDAPGHGENEHHQASLHDYLESIAICTEKFGPFAAAIGHSLGGQAISNSFASSQPPIPLILIAAPASIRNTTVSFCNVIGAGNEVYKRIISSIEKTYDVNVDEFSAKHLLQLNNPPGLIIQDKEDLDVPYSNAIELHQSWKNAELISTSKLGHRRVLSDPTVLERIMLYLKTNVV